MERTLAITQRSDPKGPVVLGVEGELDHHTAPRLNQVVEALGFAPGVEVVVDLSSLEYCDSTGITVLISAHQQAQAAGATLSIAGVNPNLRRVFEVVGLDQVFTLHPTVGQAIDHLRG